MIKEEFVRIDPALVNNFISITESNLEECEDFTTMLGNPFNLFKLSNLEKCEDFMKIVGRFRVMVRVRVRVKLI